MAASISNGVILMATVVMKANGKIIMANNQQPMASENGVISSHVINIGVKSKQISMWQWRNAISMAMII